MLSVFRGIARVTSAGAGLLLVYGAAYAMEAMAVRLPMSTARELLGAVAYTLPWTLLCCSGFDDFAIVAKRRWPFWGGTVLLLVFLGYFEWHTTSFRITKIAMPLLVTAGGVLPRILPRLRFAYTVCSLLAGIAGVFAAYYLGAALFSGASFATTTIAAVFVAFCVGSLATGVLAFVSLHHRLRSWQQAQLT